MPPVRLASILTAHVGRRQERGGLVKPLAAWGSNWSGSQARAQTAFQQGVEGYNGDWAGATTAQQGAMTTNWNQSINNGTWANGVRAVGTNGWKSKTVARISNYGTGFSAGAADYNAAAQKIYNALTTIVPSLPPRGTFEQNKLRSTSLMDQLHALRGTLGAR